MFPALHPDVTFSERPISELERKYVHHLQDFWLALHGFYRLKQGFIWTDDTNMRPKLDARLAQELRELVGIWLASGLMEDGREYPYKRCLPLDLIERLNRFLRDERNGFGPYVIARAGAFRTPVPGLPELDDTTHPIPEFRKIALERKRDGERMRKSSGLNIVDGDPLCQKWHARLPEQWEQYAVDEAMRLFLTMLHAEGSRFLLVQCRKCTRYDFTKTREQYKRGWHCHDCRKGAADNASAKKSRGAMRDKWMTLAVRARRKYKPSYGEQAIWLAQQINRLLPPDQWVKRHRITRHLDEIERRAQAL